MPRFPAIALATLTFSASALVSAPQAAAVVAHHPRQDAGPARAGSNLGWSSSNWSGYARTAGAPYTSAAGTWVVPTVAPSRRASYSSNWVGIDGFNNSNLIQTGTESDYYNGSAHYYAWWEILPAAETLITTMTVRPGDSITGTLTKGSGSSWTISLADSTNGQHFSIQQNYSGPGASVEWIEEAPTIGGRIGTLANYSSPDTFDPGSANGGNPGLMPADGGAMVQKGIQVSTPSAPDSDTDGFNVSYGATAPAPPGS